jgi:hypothetical protein
MTKRGHEAPLLDNSSQPNLFNQQGPVQEQTDAPVPAEGAAQTLAPKPIAEIMDEHASREAEKAAKKEQLINANWLPGRIEQELDRLFPDLRSPETTERQEQDRDRQARLRAAASGGTHPTGTRGKKYHFDNDNARVDSDRDPA